MLPFTLHRDDATLCVDFDGFRVRLTPAEACRLAAELRLEAEAALFPCEDCFHGRPQGRQFVRKCPSLSSASTADHKAAYVLSQPSGAGIDEPALNILSACVCNT